tara:strand:- start:3741 stop:4094 length:354 start_codon:yes stop_codon:yes gene_type:complete
MTKLTAAEAMTKTSIQFAETLRVLGANSDEAEVELDPTQINITLDIDGKTSSWVNSNQNGPVWVTVTHLPTLISARMFSENPHKARHFAIQAVKSMVAEIDVKKCENPVNVSNKAMF